MIQEYRSSHRLVRERLEDVPYLQMGAWFFIQVTWHCKITLIMLILGCNSSIRRQLVCMPAVLRSSIPAHLLVMAIFSLLKSLPLYRTLPYVKNLTLVHLGILIIKLGLLWLLRFAELLIALTAVHLSVLAARMTQDLLMFNMVVSRMQMVLFRLLRRGLPHLYLLYHPAIKVRHYNFPF